MKNALSLILLLLSSPLLYAEVTAVDDVGATVTLDKPAQRIITLTPHATELLYAAGAGEHIVATVDYSDYPLEAIDLPRIGSASRVDFERVVALQPDLIVAWASGNPRAMVERLQTLGYPVYFSEPRRLEQIPENIVELGRLAGVDGAGAVAKGLSERISALHGAEADPPLRVFYQIWDRPLMTLSGEHILSDVIHRCGGENTFNDLSALATEVSVEGVLARRPQVIMAGDRPKREPLALWQRWRQLPAVVAGNLILLSADLLQRPGPRLIDGAEQLCAALKGAATRLK